MSHDTALGQLVRPARMSSSRLRMSIQGGAGSGKTYTALAIASELGGRVVVIDTEHGSADKYARDFRYDVTSLPVFEPIARRAFNGCPNLVPNDPRLAAAAVRTLGEHYDVLIVDSGSLVWMASKESVDIEKQGCHGNSFAAWGKVTPRWKAFTEACISVQAHTIVTMRVKTAYVLEQDRRGKQVPREVGLEPVWRDDAKYLFDVSLELDAEHVARVAKTRCSDIADEIFPRPGRELAERLKSWLDIGGDAEAECATTTPEPPRAMMPPRRAYLSQPEHRAMGDRVASLPVEGMLILVSSETVEGREYRVQRLDGGAGWSCECEKGVHTRSGEGSECVHARRAELKLMRFIMGDAWGAHMADRETGIVPEWNTVDKAELPELVARAHEWVARTGGAS